MRRPVLLMFSLLTWSMPAAAQVPPPGPAPSVLFAYRQGGVVKSIADGRPSDSAWRPTRSNYRTEGATFGGALGAVGGAVLGYRLCGLARESTTHCTGNSVLGGVIGAVLLAIPGAVIGGQFSKQRARPEHQK